MKCSLGISNFLERSLVFPILLFSSISLHWSLNKAFLSLLAILCKDYLKSQTATFQLEHWINVKCINSCFFICHRAMIIVPLSPGCCGCWEITGKTPCKVPDLWKGPSRMITITVIVIILSLLYPQMNFFLNWTCLYIHTHINGGYALSKSV